MFTVTLALPAALPIFTPAVQVAAQDAAGNTVPSFSGSVTVALGGTNPAGGTLAGTTTVAAVNGVASFATFNIGKAGSREQPSTAAARGACGARRNASPICDGIVKTSS